MVRSNFGLMHPIDQIIPVINRIYRNGLTTTSGGNLSVKDESLLQAFDRLEVAEFSAKSLCMGKAIGESFPIGDDEIDELKKTILL